MVSIHPELTASNQLEIKLVVGGDTHQHALELVKKMEDSKRFQDTQINQESRAIGNSAPGGDAVQFDITRAVCSGSPARTTAPGNWRAQ